METICKSYFLKLNSIWKFIITVSDIVTGLFSWFISKTRSEPNQTPTMRMLWYICIAQVSYNIHIIRIQLGIWWRHIRDVHRKYCNALHSFSLAKKINEIARHRHVVYICACLVSRGVLAGIFELAKTHQYTSSYSSTHSLIALHFANQPFLYSELHTLNKAHRFVLLTCSISPNNYIVQNNGHD